MIGEVAGLNLGWYEDRPLFGRTVVVTRAGPPGLPAQPRASGTSGRRSSKSRSSAWPHPQTAGRPWGLAPPGLARRRRLCLGRVHFRQRRAAVLRTGPRHPLPRACAGGERSARRPPRRCGPTASWPTSSPSDYQAEGLLDVVPVSAGATQGLASVLLPQAAGARPELRRGLEARLAGRRRRGLPDCAPAAQPGASGGGRTGRRHLFRLFVGGRQLPRPGPQRGRRSRPSWPASARSPRPPLAPGGWR